MSVRADPFDLAGWGVAAPPSTVFGVPLGQSLRYASVQISTADANGEMYVWGYVPVVVAKWSVIVLPLRHRR